ncbi:carbohydrate ABC transporter permease [Algisphaera agarilytica]|uniref:ABC-type glycerol-3-phosphate transport system permease component n=1 Tax=Algisphaera agarilytica TaxID=1385975 RepID=A0A7X0LKQ3_9BACT|nr:carbohydrate ABC transporter permease [Algisphaera agarilytica]MBB6429871.1 ABC-type glycerol-3-phosphate transport system permease component [Algisphaera agarilytica]
MRKKWWTPVAIYVPLAAFALVTLVPFAYLMFSAFKTKEAFFSGPFWPVEEDGGWWAVDWSGFTFTNFTRLWSEVKIGEASFMRAVLNSFFFASVMSVVGTLGAAMGGYGLAMFKFKGREFITTVVLGALVIPGALLIAPGYFLLFQLGLLDSYAGLILPGVAPAFGVYLFRQAFISSLPHEMMEAGRIDGCGEWRMFFQMGLPMVKPMVGAFVLITYLGTWTNFIGPQIIIQTPEKYPLAVAVAQLRGPFSIEYGMIMAGTLVAIGPVLALFLLLQKDFIAGLTAGAVKG